MISDYDESAKEPKPIMPMEFPPELTAALKAAELKFLASPEFAAMTTKQALMRWDKMCQEIFFQHFPNNGPLSDVQEFHFFVLLTRACQSWGFRYEHLGGTEHMGII